MGESRSRSRASAGRCASGAPVAVVVAAVVWVAGGEGVAVVAAARLKVLLRS